MAHRDLCPEHIVITAGGALQLIAFGFARHVPCSVSRTVDGQLVPGKLRVDSSVKQWPLPASPAQWRPSAANTISSADHLPVVTRRPAAAAASTMAAKAAAEMAAAKRAAVLAAAAADGTDPTETTGAAAAGGENGACVACGDGEGDGDDGGDDDETNTEDGDGDGEATEQAIRARGPSVRYAAPEVCSLSISLLLLLP